VPTYQYACTACGHELEAVQSFSDEALTRCPACEGRLRKVFSAVGIVFKGSGFYRTDSRGDKSGSTVPAGSNGGKDAASTPAASSDSGSAGKTPSSGGSESGATAAKSDSAKTSKATAAAVAST
jgi:putative FmdB family regulatory protein